ncbi:tetratricopeptide repeat protein [Arhodomonas sp. AD133]|uniref:tetratricopeptide repeat protein n=1 Tax=Arhodomonas sp. AD133 TaxID=3415009 RepID=UPI003EC0A4A0
MNSEERMRRYSILLALVAVIAGCATRPADEPAEPASAETSGAVDFDSDHDRLLYQLLVGEFAGNRGAFERAADAYVDAAGLSQDPSVAARAARVALYADRLDLAKVAADRWLALAPQAREASRVLALIALREGDAVAAAEQFVRVIPAADGGRAQVFRQIGAELAQQADAETALAVAESLAGRFPGEAAAQFALGKVALQTGYFEEALAAAEDALALRPDWRAAALLEVEALQRLGRIGEANDRLARMVAASPGDNELRYEYARLLAMAGDTGKALAQFRQLLRNQPDDPRTLLTGSLLAMRGGEHDQARSWLMRLLALEARTDAAHYYLARLATDEGRYEQALEHYELAGGDYRTDASLGVARVMAAQGRIDEARRRLQALRAEDAGAAVPAYVTEAEVLRGAGRIKDSLAVLGQALSEFPENTELLYARAMTRVASGVVDAAIADLEAIVEREPDNAVALNALGYTLADEGRQLERAARLVRRAYALSPDSAAVVDSMGWVAYRQGRLAEARDYLERAYRLSPGAEIAAHFGEVLWQLGEREQAREIWTEALQRQPGHDVLHDTVNRLTDGELLP